MDATGNGSEHLSKKHVTREGSVRRRMNSGAVKREEGLTFGDVLPLLAEGAVLRGERGPVVSDRLETLLPVRHC